MKLRKPELSDAQVLTELAFRSKAHWGYDQALLQKWRDELTVTDSFLKTACGMIAEQDGHIVGFWLREPSQTADITNGFLFIEPSHMGKGIGRALFLALKEDLMEKGVTSFTIEADPNAAPFYYKMGGKKIGDKPSQVVPGRYLPIIHFELFS